MMIGGQRVIWASALAGTLGATMLAGGCGSEGARRTKTTAQFMASASRVCRFEQDKLASGIADGLLRFLADTPRAQIFKDDIVVKLPAPAPSASP